MIPGGVADGQYRITLQIPFGGDWAGLKYRVSDIDNFWFVWAHATIVDTFNLTEVNGGVATLRATVGAVNAPGVDQEVTALADGTAHQCYLNGDSRLAWTSAFNQNAVDVGFRGISVGLTFDNFHINRRTGTQYNRLSKCG
jgi:hypothetical protein